VNSVMDRFAVGVDLGGTKIAAGVVNIETGQLVGSARKKTRTQQEQDDLVKRLISAIDEALQEAGLEAKHVVGIGVGAPGQVNREKGILLFGPNLAVNDMPITDPISAHFGVPCRLGNDVEVATLGEQYFGAGRGCSSFVCVFVGTGIGSGIIQDGKQHLGASATAGEIGHIVLVPDGKQCGCGAFGCLEAYASRTAITKAIVAALNRGQDSSIREKVDLVKGALRSKAIANAIVSGDDLVTSIVTSAAQSMGSGLATIINFYNPSRIILGGGVIEAIELYFHIAEQEARRRALPIPGRRVEIVRAELGDYAGIIGAALLVRSRELATNLP
jgi:glucokinase